MRWVSFLPFKTAAPKYGVLCLVGVLLAGCSKETPYTERPLDDIYQEGMRKLKEKRFEKASEEFDQVEQQYPYSEWAPKAQLLSAYALYRHENYERAIGILENFTHLHPYHPFAAYAYYLRALCFYEQIGSVDRDMINTELAFDALNELINRYPNTIYAKDARFKRDFAFNQMAAHHMVVGRYYQRQGTFIGAIGRFQRVTDRFNKSVYTPEALYRLVECNLSLGLKDEAHRTAQVLAHNFPKNLWYKDAYTLIQKHVKTPTTQKVEALPSPQSTADKTKKA
ncbi:MAG: outer membrane protein assembly factor BamD [Holosporaceae bacterium]